MIKLSKMTDYAVVILAEMAGQGGALMNASILSERTKLPEPTVSKVLKLLARHKLLTSTRGVNGGYSLEKPAAEIDMASLITALEGPILLTECVDKTGGNCCDRADYCTIKGKWNPVNAAMQSALEKVSLAQMMGEQPS